MRVNSSYVLGIIEGWIKPKELSIGDLKRLYNVAKANKVEYLLLKRLYVNYRNSFVEREYKTLSLRYYFLLDKLSRITLRLDELGIKHAYIKTFRSVNNVTTDADLLILGDIDDYLQAVDIVTRIIRHRTYKVGGRSTSIKLKGVNAWVDIYEEPGLNHIIYFPKKLIDKIEYRNICLDNDYCYKLPTPILEIDLPIIIGHAIIKEHRIDLLEVETLFHSLDKVDIDLMNEYIETAGLRRSLEYYVSLMYNFIEMNYSDRIDILKYIENILPKNKLLKIDIADMPYYLTKSMFIDSLISLIKSSRYSRYTFIEQIYALFRSRKNLAQFVRESIIHIGWLK